jgi:hypothetical protein
MNQSEINLPTAMTPEAHRAIEGVCLDPRLFAYGPNDWGTAAWYKEKYPGFTDEQYRVFEMYSSGMNAKQHRNALKKAAKNNKANSKCSR